MKNLDVRKAGRIENGKWKIENGAKKARYCMKSGFRDGVWGWLMADGYWQIADCFDVESKK